MAKNYIVFLPFLFFFFPLNAQVQTKSFTVKYITTPITVDGVLDEEIWQIAESANTFQQYFPTDSVIATQKTEIKMFNNGNKITHFHIFFRQS